jgi:hypothetical protein
MDKLSDYFEYINYNHPELIEEIKEYVLYAEKNNQFWISKFKQCRIDLPIEICLKIKKIMPFKVSEYGCFKNVPGWSYAIHKDSDRQFAMNMLISDNNDKFKALCYNDDKTENTLIPYIKNQWVMLNTKKFHEVRNESNVNRYVISIGCTTTDYSSMYNLFKINNNIGYCI